MRESGKMTEREEEEGARKEEEEERGGKEGCWAIGVTPSCAPLSIFLKKNFGWLQIGGKEASKG